MGTSIKRTVRNRLVDDSAVRGFLGVTTTGSAAVSPVFMEKSGTYPQIIYSETMGSVDPGISATNGLLTFSVEAQATGGVNPHSTIENIAERIDQLFDDQSLSGIGLSGTAAYVFLFTREGGPEIIFNDERKIYQKFLSFNYKVLKY